MKMGTRRFQKFIRYKRSKNLIIGCLSIMILLLGGIKLYKTFALYEEKNEYNVLKGIIPNFKAEPINLIEYIESLSETEELEYDGTADNNLRYTGANPNNYVKFNNELWRIIGIMNNIEDSEENKYSHVKIIKTESMGNYSWTKSSKDIPDWNAATLQSYLNEEYLNGLTEESQSMVSNIVWNLGQVSNIGNITGLMAYNAERGDEVYNGCQTVWLGKIALPYLSDYAFTNLNQKKCFSMSLSNLSSTCSNIWLNKNLSSFMWLLNPLNYKSPYKEFYAAAINTIGNYQSKNLWTTNAVFPSLYLNTDVMKVKGSGTSEDPIILQ